MTSVQTDPVLAEMLNAMATAPEIVQPSLFWEDLSLKHMKALDLENFKRTLALQYFTFMCDKKDPQIRFLEEQFSKPSKMYQKMRALFSKRFPEFTARRSLYYVYLTRLLWKYTASKISNKDLQLEEPAVGKPLLVNWNSRRVTQDLANSLLEYHTIVNGMGCEVSSALELGAGYGRLAYVFLKKMPRCKFLICDIPPALFVAQSYLTQVFPNKTVLLFRNFNHFSEIKEEYAQADLCFFLPHQLEMLPAGSIELGINISSLHEMRRDQISYYFSQFSRLLTKHFYFKQWKSSFLPLDNITIKEKEYPIPSEWQQIFWQSCAVQTAFFEALFKIN